MYAGTTIRRGSGKIVGVHQKIDRVACRYFKKYTPKSVTFPNIKSILHFEGKNGPDGLKRKNPALDDTWHFIDPNDQTDRNLINIINNHIINLSAALRNNDQIKAAFEASWLAHAIVDGLTPAHHYPLGDKIEELWGKAHHERSSIIEKNIILGDGLRDTISKNWQYWGAGGAFTTHGVFEMGVASAISTDNFKNLKFSKRNITKLEKVGFETVFLESLHKINDLQLFEKVKKRGWTQQIARQIRVVLVPEMIKLVILAWYQASINSGK